MLGYRIVYLLGTSELGKEAMPKEWGKAVYENSSHDLGAYEKMGGNNEKPNRIAKERIFSELLLCAEHSQTASHFIVLRCCPGRYCLGAARSTTTTHSTAEGSYKHLVGGDGWN